MPHSQLHLKRAADLEAAAAVGLPGSHVPAELVLRSCVATILALCAAGGIAVALNSQWWKIWYDHKDLCTVNASVCGLDMEVALTWLCLHTPTNHLCASATELAGAKFQDEAEAVRISEIAWLLLFIALVLHLPLTIVLLVLLCLSACGKNRQIRACGFRCAACLAVLAVTLLVAGLGIVFVSVPDYMKFARRMVGHTFGRLAMQEPKLQTSLSIGCIVCTAAISFDLLLTLLTFNAGNDAASKRYPNHEIYTPSAFDLHLMPFAAGLAPARSDYMPVLTSEEAAAMDMTSSENRQLDTQGRINDLKTIGRYQQWRPPFPGPDIDRRVY